MKLVAGLGNYGLKYQKTYHNMGFMAADLLAKILNVKFNKREGKALTAHCFIQSEKVIIAKPLTYMNLSGESIKAICDKYKISLEDVLIIYDDIDLDKGQLRIRKSGSGGTHNGMKNIVQCLGSKDFKRIRIGIGKPDNPRQDLADYVLGRISTDFEDMLDSILTNAADAAKEFCENIDIEKIMQKYNTKA